MSKTSVQKQAMDQHKESIDYPKAPPFFSKEKEKVWLAVLCTRDVTYWSTDSLVLVEGLVNAIVTSRKLEKLFEKALKTEDLEQVITLQKMVDKSQRLVISFATKLRLTKQAQVTPDKARSTSLGTTAPWIS